MFQEKQEIKFDTFNKRNSLVFSCSAVFDNSKTQVIGWKFKCPVCGILHYHSPFEGFREAHCTKRSSSLHKTGYYLKLESSVNIPFNYIQASQACIHEDVCDSGNFCNGNIFNCHLKITSKLSNVV